MPIEIRELHFKAVIADTSENEPAANNGGKKGANEKIIAECVDKIMEILKLKQER